MSHDRGDRDFFSLLALFTVLVMCLCLVGFGAEFYITKVLFNRSVPGVVVVGVLVLVVVGLRLSAVILAEFLLALGFRRQSQWITTKVLGKRLY